MNRVFPRRLSRVLTPLAPAITFLLLAVLAGLQWQGADGRSPTRSRDVSSALAGALPASIGPWIARPWGPPAASAHPVDPIDRSGSVYENVETGRRIAVLRVEGALRDLRKYTLASWYGDRGWRVLGTDQVTWLTAGPTVPAMRCELTNPGRQHAEEADLGPVSAHLTATSFVVLPDGRLAASPQGQPGPGAPQPRPDRPAMLVQVAFPGDMPGIEQEQTMNRLIGALILSIQQEETRAGDQS